MTPEQFSERFHQAVDEVSRVLVGQRPLVEQTLVALFARGHVLVEGVPGLGKTLLVRTLARVLGVAFKRIQFTPDLMPADVTGGNVYDQSRGAFVFSPGPLFAGLVLADEVNRAPAKTQSALLEAMQERSVTTDGTTRALPAPFLVVATQNPVESQGTYPLPEAQLDRFLMKLDVGYPARDAELQVLAHVLVGFDAAELDRVVLTQVLDVEGVLAMQAALRAVHVEPDVLGYVVDLVAHTRAHPSVALGASPRASVGLLGAARARAASEGRGFVTPDDVRRDVHAVLRHRLVLHPDAELEGTSADACVDAALREVPVPQAAR